MTVLNSRPLRKLLSREMYFGIGIRLFSGYFGADTALKYSYTLATSSLSGIKVTGSIQSESDTNTARR